MTNALPGQGLTPENVAKLATNETDLNLRTTTLIGLLGSPKAPSALLRLSSGKIVTVRPGDRVAGRQVSAIGDDSITLGTGAGTKRLHMPGS
ncbi:pilus assembly protein PilZ [Chachezhania sediminis]|uniref:pilus assembly protein PilZ n=1 Tax=Chachezhania sediminis TaxID=2599291 RepID=UPI00131DD366|nr:pilus assembly protein PilZ [Chachezhania sediminis]